MCLADAHEEGVDDASHCGSGGVNACNQLWGHLESKGEERGESERGVEGDLKPVVDGNAFNPSEEGSFYISRIVKEDGKKEKKILQILRLTS